MGSLLTLFNVRWEPIVQSQEGAFHCFMGTELDVLVCGNTILRKEDQNQTLQKDYKINMNLIKSLLFC